MNTQNTNGCQASLFLFRLTCADESQRQNNWEPRHLDTRREVSFQPSVDLSSAENRFYHAQHRYPECFYARIIQTARGP